MYATPTETTTLASGQARRNGSDEMRFCSDEARITSSSLDSGMWSSEGTGQPYVGGRDRQGKGEGDISRAEKGARGIGMSEYSHFHE